MSCTRGKSWAKEHSVCNVLNKWKGRRERTKHPSCPAHKKMQENKNSVATISCTRGEGGENGNSFHQVLNKRRHRRDKNSTAIMYSKRRKAGEKQERRGFLSMFCTKRGKGAEEKNPLQPPFKRSKKTVTVFLWILIVHSVFAMLSQWSQGLPDTIDLVVLLTRGVQQCTAGGKNQQEQHHDNPLWSLGLDVTECLLDLVSV